MNGLFQARVAACGICVSAACVVCACFLCVESVRLFLLLLTSGLA